VEFGHNSHELVTRILSVALDRLLDATSLAPPVTSPGSPIHHDISRSNPPEQRRVLIMIFASAHSWKL
jgi:hypothetical protein